jgi:DNA-directed RNA polymerase subunit RPC12/RpoP
MNYHDFQKSQQKCSHCGWEGSGRETEVLESFAELAERACPRCHEKIAVVMYPTIAESRANWQDLEPERFCRSVTQDAESTS